MHGLIVTDAGGVGQSVELWQPFTPLTIWQLVMLADPDDSGWRENRGSSSGWSGGLKRQNVL